MPTIVNTNIQTETKVEEQTEFDVILTGHPSDRKIETIKRIRQITGLGLIESKKAVESVPFIIKEGISKDEAEKIESIFLDLGNIIEITIYTPSGHRPGRNF